MSTGQDQAAFDLIVGMDIARLSKAEHGQFLEAAKEVRATVTDYIEVVGRATTAYRAMARLLRRATPSVMWVVDELDAQRRSLEVSQRKKRPAKKR